MGRRAIVSIGLLLVFACSAGHAAPAVRDGDLIFQTSKSTQSVAVQRATGSPYSHMGLIIHRKGVPLVFEAAGKVSYTPLEKWIARGEGKRYVVKRLRGAEAQLTPEVIEKARATLQKFEGKPYDLAFEWSDRRMYCSELVWKIYDRVLGVRIGELQKLKEFNLEDPAVRAKMRERYGDDVPLEEPVISPAAMFDSPLLELVSEN